MINVCSKNRHKLDPKNKYIYNNKILKKQGQDKDNDFFFLFSFFGDNELEVLKTTWRHPLKWRKQP